MGKKRSSFGSVIMIWWVTVWWAILGAAAPLERRRDNERAQAQQQSEGHISQGLIFGLSAGGGVLLLIGITLLICFPPRRWARNRSARPLKPWIKQTTTTTVTSQSRNRGSESTDSLTDTAAPVPMTRIANIDKRGRYIISKEVEIDAPTYPTGPSTRRPPATLNRYSVHVTSNGNNAVSSRGGGPLSPLPEEVGGAPKSLTSETAPFTTTKRAPNTRVLPSASTMPSAFAKSDLADRRGRPALQSIHVPPTPANVKVKGKLRIYHH